jgi:hypothetical protein
MFYDLLIFNNDYHIVKLNDSIKNKFLTSFLIGLDSTKYLKLDNIDMNKTTEHYYDKLNKIILDKFNKKFNKSNIYHLELLSNICKVNLIVFDQIKNKIVHLLDNGYDNGIYLINNNNIEHLLLQQDTILDTNITVNI